MRPTARTAAQIVEVAGLNALGKNPSIDSLESALKKVAPLLTGADAIRRRLVSAEAVKLLTAAGVTDSKALTDAAFGTSGTSVTFDEIDPSAEAVDAADLLDCLREFLTRFVSFSPSQSAAVALWILLTWMVDAVDTMPLLAISSPEKRCGKTTLLTLLNQFVKRPIGASSLTEASLFRMIEQYRPTLLIDEADTFLASNDGMRGILNAGHTRELAFVFRSMAVGGDYELRKYDVFGPKVTSEISRGPGDLTGERRNPRFSRIRA